MNLYFVESQHHNLLERRIGQTNVQLYVYIDEDGNEQKSKNNKMSKVDEREDYIGYLTILDIETLNFYNWLKMKIKCEY